MIKSSEEEVKQQLQRLDQAWKLYRERPGAALDVRTAQYVYDRAKYLTARQLTVLSDDDVVRLTGHRREELRNQQDQLGLNGRQQAGLEKRVDLLVDIAKGRKDIDTLTRMPRRQPNRTAVTDEGSGLNFSFLRFRINIRRQ